MNKIIVTSISCTGKRIEVRFAVEGEIQKYFNTDIFWAEYSEEISITPEGIAVIPFVCNVLPIVWLTDANLELPELDSDFFNSIEKFKQGYINMYPMLTFKGEVKTSRLFKSETTTPPQQKETSAAFFSGGVDAFATLIAHASEHPMLMTLWGSDIALDDTEGWQIVENHLLETARTFQTQAVTIKTNFRRFINDAELNRLVAAARDSYWHGFQHGIGIIGHGAPMAWKHGFSKLYIASTFTANDNVPCASHPDIDGNVRFTGTRVFHDQYEFDRQAKVDHICEYSGRTGRKFTLRVCWKTSGGKNCCRCEKCLRTMFELFAAGRDPRDFGFDYSNADLRKSKLNIFSKGLDYISIQGYWKPIKHELTHRPHALMPEQIKWIETCDFDKESKSRKMRAALFIHNLPARIRFKLLRIINK